LSPADVVSILESDPDLGERLGPAERDEARLQLTARSISVGPGPWDPGAVWSKQDGPAVGLLVCDGLLTRQIVVADRPSTELLGATDLLRPWDQDGDVGLMPVEISWQVIARTDMAILDHDFLMRALRWPGVVEALLARTLRRARWLAFLVGMKQIMRVEGRLLVLFWALSERWGVVTPRGVHVRLKLTHEALGRLVGARRPSVTTALGALTAAGMIERQKDGYLLFGDAAEAMRRAGA
jgi:CRP/FNR family transcriptional regulator, cyclic AMP receptor protein